MDDTMEARAARILEGALAQGRDALLEREGFALIEALGIGVPIQRFVRDRDDAAAVDLGVFPGELVVVKAASPALPHKTDVGAVAVVASETAAVCAAIERMAQRLQDVPGLGFTISQYIPHSESLGGELLLGLRYTEDFGPVVVVGPGGVHAELLARHLVPGADLAVLAPGISKARIAAALAERPATRVAAGLGRDRRTLVPLEALVDLVERLLSFAAGPAGAEIAELEINPLAMTAGGPVALDCLVTLRRPRGTPPADRPLAKIGKLLHPGTIALVGVSREMNPGRVILGNLLRAGFPADRLAIVKPGVESIDGVRCHPDIAALPAPVDLCILAVAAAQVPDLLDQIVTRQKAESVIVIPAGLGEQQGSGSLEQRMRDTLAAARGTSWGGPVVNGGNCLGVRSAPGRYDATFIPAHKIRRQAAATAPVALLSQSGAFAISRWSKLAGQDPYYLISVGNQTDLTLGDYLTYLKDDPAVEVFACYAEGFRPGDGRRWLDAAAEIVDSGRTVLLYRAGRTPAGVRAGASHTAAIAGDYLVMRELARAAGVVVADSLEAFDDLLRLFSLLSDRRAGGMRLGVLSNAGFECVAAADALGRFELARLGTGTIARLEQVLEHAGLSRVVAVGHPFDVSPMTGDAAFAACLRAILDDDHVDAAVAGVVPLTPALETLPPGAGHTEDLAAADAVAAGLGHLRDECHKPWIAVVDAGSPYDPLAAQLEAARIPTFRSVDRALAAFATWCAVTSRHARPVDPYDAAHAAAVTGP